MRWVAGVIAGWVVCVGTAWAQYCGPMPPSGRNVEVPAGWEAGPHPTYPDLARYRLGEGTSAVFVIVKPTASACANLQDPEGTTAVHRPVYFPQRYARFWVEEEYGTFHACKDTGYGGVMVVLSLGDAPPSSQTILELTTAIADSYDYAIRCPGDPEPPPPPEPSRPGLDLGPSRTHVLLAAGAGYAGDIPRFGAYADARLSLIGRMSILAYEPYARAGLGFDGGVFYDVSLRGGFGFGADTWFAVLGGVGARGVSDDRLPAALVFTARAVYSRPLGKRYRLFATADASWAASCPDDPTMPMAGCEFTPWELEPAVNAVVSRGRLGLGVEARGLGDGVSVVAFFGLAFNVVE